MKDFRSMLHNSASRWLNTVPGRRVQALFDGSTAKWLCMKYIVMQIYTATTVTVAIATLL